MIMSAKRHRQETQIKTRHAKTMSLRSCFRTISRRTPKTRSSVSVSDRRTGLNPFNVTFTGTLSEVACGVWSPFGKRANHTTLVGMKQDCTRIHPSYLNLISATSTYVIAVNRFRVLLPLRPLFNWRIEHGACLEQNLVCLLLLDPFAQATQCMPDIIDPVKRQVP